MRRMCRMLDVSPSAYYAWRARPESRRVSEDRRLLVEIKAIHQAKRGGLTAALEFTPSSRPRAITMA